MKFATESNDTRPCSRFLKHTFRYARNLIF